MDYITQEPIPYVLYYNTSKTCFSYSDINGELKDCIDNDTLVFSHLGYENLTTDVAKLDGTARIILLRPASQIIDQVTIQSSRRIEFSSCPFT